MNKLFTFFLLIFLIKDCKAMDNSIWPVAPSKKTHEQKRLKDELYELESQIFYTKHLSPINIIRERMAFLIGATGLMGSFIVPFKLIKSSPDNPYHVLAKRAKITGATIVASTGAACVLTYVRPILWAKEHKKNNLELKIFKLQNAQTKI